MSIFLGLLPRAYISGRCDEWRGMREALEEQILSCTGDFRVISSGDVKKLQALVKEDSSKRFGIIQQMLSGDE